MDQEKEKKHIVQLSLFASNRFTFASPLRAPASRCVQLKPHTAASSDLFPRLFPLRSRHLEESKNGRWGKCWNEFPGQAKEQSLSRAQAKGGDVPAPGGGDRQRNTAQQELQQEREEQSQRVNNTTHRVYTEGSREPLLSPHPARASSKEHCKSPEA